MTMTLNQQRWTQIRAGESQRSQPVFFYDGEFRTWEGTLRRAQVNQGIAAYLARSR